jgi:hypothetical protein
MTSSIIHAGNTKTCDIEKSALLIIFTLLGRWEAEWLHGSLSTAINGRTKSAVLVRRIHHHESLIDTENAHRMLAFATL